MAENDDLDARIKEGQKADELRQNPILERAFSRAEERCTAEWRKSAVGDTDKRESAYHTLRAIDLLKTEIDSVINDAKIAKSAVSRRSK